MTATRNQARCRYCGRWIFRTRDRRWYHHHNASVACVPGTPGGNKAEPRTESS